MVMEEWRNEDIVYADDTKFIAFAHHFGSRIEVPSKPLEEAVRCSSRLPEGWQEITLTLELIGMWGQCWLPQRDKNLIKIK